MAHPTQQPQVVAIEISVDTDGTFNKPPALKHVEIGDTISWFNSAGAFSVVFQKDGTPFANSLSKFNDPNQTGTTQYSGRYLYSVSAVDKKGKLHQVSGCPELEVDGGS